MSRSYTFIVKPDTVKLERVECFYKDTVTLVYKFQDVYGTAINTSTATVTFRGSIKGDVGEIFEYTQADSVNAGSDSITVSLDTEDFGQYGEMIVQLRVTLSSTVQTIEQRVKLKNLVE